MIDFIKQWANQIIVAVIIATIFEMILPNGNNKKYIKMIIGIYVLFTVVQPIVNKLTGNKFEISSFNYEKYIDKDIIETSSEDFKNNNSNLIQQAYIDNIQNDIQAKLLQKGYEATSCDIDAVSNENDENYGTIRSIKLKIKRKEEKESTSNVIGVEKVEINIDDEQTIEKSNILDEEKQNIIQYLAQEYSLDNNKLRRVFL